MIRMRCHYKISLIFIIFLSNNEVISFLLHTPAIALHKIIAKFISPASSSSSYQQDFITGTFSDKIFSSAGQSSSTAHLLGSTNINSNSYYDDFLNNEENYIEVFTDGLLQRVKEMKTDMIDYDKTHNNPNTDMLPHELVRIVLNALRNSNEPFPNSGYRTLLRCSTPKWREKVLRSIGAPPEDKNARCNDDNIISAALGAALSRPNNQYGILVNEEEGDYHVYFPSDIVDFDDGHCWLECHLVNPLENHNALMIILGWTLERRKEDGAWLVNGLDWQDFRDAYRPGIGREEWTRVYG